MIMLNFSSKTYQINERSKTLMHDRIELVNNANSRIKNVHNWNHINKAMPKINSYE